MKIIKRQLKRLIESIINEESEDRFRIPGYEGLERFRMPGYEGNEGFRLPDDFGQEAQKATGAAKLVAEKLVDLIDADSGEGFEYGVYADIDKIDEASGLYIVSLTDMSGMGGIVDPEDVIHIHVIIADEGEGVNIRIKDNKPSYAGKIPEYEFANERDTIDMFIMGPENREISVQKLVLDIFEDIKYMFT